MPRSCPCTGSEEYVHVRLKKDTHFLWTERKCTFCLKSTPHYIEEIHSFILGAFEHYKHYLHIHHIQYQQLRSSHVICSKIIHAWHNDNELHYCCGCLNSFVNNDCPFIVQQISKKSFTF